MRFILLFLSFLSTLHADQVRDFWFNGAEISSFELSQSRYGKNHPGHAELIFVTEPFLTSTQVKNESGKGDSTDVLKLNALTTFNTGIYSYRTMTSTFRPTDLGKFPHAVKSSSSVQEWCGQVFQQFNRRENGWSVQLRSYFENEADSNSMLGEAYLEDELWITLRLDPGKLPTGDFDAIPGAIFTRFHHRPIKIEKAKGALKIGDKITTYTIAYPSLGRVISIGFDKNFPHIIRAWTETTPTGDTTAKLKKRLMNIAYWEMHDPDDTEKRKLLGLQPIPD